MGNVNTIIAQLNIIAAARYKSVHGGPASSRKTLHEQAFDKVKGSAQQVSSILGQNPNPNRDQKENITAQFNSMKKNVDVYCPKTAGTDNVLRAFNKAFAEWELFK